MSSDSAVALTELAEFLDPQGRLDLKALAIQTLLSLTASKEGRQLIFSSTGTVLLSRLARLIFEDEQESIRFDSLLFLINLTSDQEFSILDEQHLPITDPFWLTLLKHCIRDGQYEHADAGCKLFSNVTSRSNVTKHLEELIVHFDQSYPEWLDHLVDAFSTINYNQKKNNLDYLAAFLVNLTQIKSFRQRLRNGQYLPRLLCFTARHHSTIRRGSVACLLKNCCFDHECHEYMVHQVGQNDDFICSLLLPLAGSTTEELTDEENEQLPIDLQYLPIDKQRESDQDIQLILLETILLLCATKPVRQYFRSTHIYLILRQYHQQLSQDFQCSRTCERIIQILIGDEDNQVETDNFLELNIPTHLRAKFEEADRKEEEENKQELQ